MVNKYRKEVKKMSERNTLVEEAKRLGVHEVGEKLTESGVKPILTFKQQTGSYLDRKGLRNRKRKRKIAQKSRKRNRK